MAKVSQASISNRLSFFLAPCVLSAMAETRSRFLARLPEKMDEQPTMALQLQKREAQSPERVVEKQEAMRRTQVI